MREKRMRDLFWVGDSKKRLMEFPGSVQQEIGYTLEGVQSGATPHKVKLLKGFSGVYEIVSNYARNTYRAVYVVNLGDMIYVLHCFQKKSRRRIKTPKREIDRIRRRLNTAQTLAQKEREDD